MIDRRNGRTNRRKNRRGTGMGKGLGLAGIAVVALLALGGCGESRDERAANRILEALREKYGEEFAVSGIGGGWGTMNRNTLKAIAYPKDDPTLKVPVEITKDYSRIYDLYLNQRVARSEEPKLEELARAFWPDAEVIVANDTRLTYPEENDTAMSYSEFQRRYPMNTQLVSIYLDGDAYIGERGEVDETGEVDKYMTFADELKKRGYVSSMVTWVYLSKDAYGRLDEARASQASVDVFFTDEETDTGVRNIRTMAGYSLDEQGKIMESRAEIEAYFDIWKEQRLGRSAQ